MKGLESISIDDLKQTIHEMNMEIARLKKEIYYLTHPGSRNEEDIIPSLFDDNINLG